MELAVSGTEVIITGDIKSFDDYLQVQRTVKSLIFEKGQTALTIRIIDSIIITSSVIGFFIRLILKDKVKISMYIHDERLCNMLDTLNLGELFNIKKI